MNIFNPFGWGTKVIPPVEKKSSTVPLGVGLSSFLRFGMQGGATTPGGAMHLYEQSSAVATPIDYIADSFSSIRPVLREVESRSIIRRHPILDRLNVPSDDYDGRLFAEVLATDYLITGEAGIVAIGNINRPPLALQPINPSNISVVEGSDGRAASIIVGGVTMPGVYVANRTKNGVRYIRDNLTEIKFIRRYSTKNNALLRGQSRLVSAAAEVRQHIEGNKHNVSLLENGGRLSLVFAFKNDMELDDLAETEEKINYQFGGSERAGSMVVTAGDDLDVKEVGKSNLDMDFAILHKMTKESVANRYKFPLVLLSTDAATFNNMENGMVSLYDNAVLPLSDTLYGAISDWLLPRYGEDPAKLQITYDMDQITALTGRRNVELKDLKALGVLTINELRTLMGWEPVKGGDIVYVSATMLPAGTDIFTDDNIPENAIDREDA